MIRRTLIASAFVLAATVHAEPVTKFSDSAEQNMPEWFRDSERLSQLLGGRAAGEVSDAKVVRRLETPINGLDAVVIEGMVRQDGEEPRPETFVIYLDKSGRYMVAGLMIDLKENRNVGQLVARFVRGERADIPARALDPLTMHGLAADGSAGAYAEQALMLVVDLGPEDARKNIVAIHNLRTRLLQQKKKVRQLTLVPVSEAKDEIATVASAMAFGYDIFQPGDGYNRLVEYAAKGRNTDWVSPTRLQAEPRLKEVLGVGIQRLDDNTAAAVLARLNTLPLVYLKRGGRAEWRPLPLSEPEWTELLTLPTANPN